MSKKPAIPEYRPKKEAKKEPQNWEDELNEVIM